MTEEIEKLCTDFKNKVEKVGVKNSTLKIEIKGNDYQKLDSHYNIPITIDKVTTKEKKEFMAINSLDKVLYNYATIL